MYRPAIPDPRTTHRERPLVSGKTAARLVATAAAASLLVGLGACTPSVQAAPAVATAEDAVTHAENKRVAKGARWTQHYFPSSDGSDVELHADVLLPENLPEGKKVPVILSVGAYFGHSGQLDDEKHPHTGPSNRFYDFIEGTDLFSRGYAFVMVDQRGFGGSTGCLDFQGPGEQADVKAAIDWAATQPWSTGAVGMYGKSYDAITGLIGNNLNQDALKAVVAQEPIWDLYRNIRSNGVPRSTIGNVATSYNRIATLPQLPDDDERYRTNAAYEEKHPCVAVNSIQYLTADYESEYWQTRDLARQAKGSDTPLFFTQGFTEWNTEPEGMEEYLTNHHGPQRGWLGPWDHKRGNERAADGRLEMGRDSWFAETISFFDQYLRGVTPTVDYPAYAIQDNNGRWRAQDTWPVVDSSPTLALPGGRYLDDSAEGDPKVDTGNSFYRWSQPLRQATRVTGTPRLSLTARGHGNLMVRLYDVAPDGTGVFFNEQVALVNGGKLAFDLKSNDWTLAAGHRLAVQIGTIQAPGLFSDWTDTPSNRKITVENVRLDLDLDDPRDDRPTDGERAVFLDIYTALSTTEKMPIGKPSFTVPVPLR
ncbi:CocE/NonD family hydrolase [Micromonospora yangpuensis]|uniref:Xaa-Pro dipeptidyl-peptidase C-terminal domain-containing protein n=1 Tax=Micromonospora yangpuensis TaxID=683228 RepID=A0A1C6U082_9ACTN|nr:CocE/NonD family hydrolase [Micromonospora yangpuensis]GGM11976.1 hypothetical protein GCM10012279_32610 [Micromonospora yangpuensis]SCL47444.1 hypothetical protein GA0070617_0583 [Micromonospora yangpuensis]